jgi:hypothetical protein|tara:strand:- start:2983 stop:3627 length:645 start_codon:yes stop_codon:yes gene_type:complete
MAKNNLSIELVDTDRVIVAKINKALAKEINSKMLKKVSLIKSMLKPVIATALFSSPEIISLGSGVLRFDFGLTGDPAPQIVNAVVESVDVRIKQVKGSQNGISGGLTVLVQPSSFANLLSLPVAMQKLEIEARIPWLEWLLTAGDTIIIANYGVEYGAGLGRSGGARMVSLSKAPIGPFKVNSAFSGSVDNNFITRAMVAAEPEIKKAIIGAFK